jgi:hypothetical protein
MKFKLILLFLVLFLSCISAPPKQSDPNNSAIGISITVEPSCLTFKNIAFIRLNSIDDSLIQYPIIFSNDYYSTTFMRNLLELSGAVDNFLFDIKPGIYAAVGAYAQENSSEYLILFPEKMIKSTIIEVKPNSLVYSGRFYLKTPNLFETIAGEKKEIDNTQRYYHRPLLQELKKIVGNLVMIHVLTPSLDEVKQSTEIENKFLKIYQNTFKDTEWAEKINNRLKSLE